MKDYTPPHTHTHENNQNQTHTNSNHKHLLSPTHKKRVESIKAVAKTKDRTTAKQKERRKMNKYNKERRMTEWKKVPLTWYKAQIIIAIQDYELKHSIDIIKQSYVHTI